NLSWEDATPHADQGALTIETTSAELVENDPVLPHTGEMTYRLPLVRIPGTGLDFTFVLYYRSGFVYPGPVGNNWEHNWNARILEKNNGDIVRYSNGRADTYAAEGGGIFTPPPGQFESSVTQSTSGSDLIIERQLQDGTLETYVNPGATGSWYYLKSVAHRNSNNVIDLSYDSTHVLTKITDTRGRDFKLQHATSGHLTALEDWSSAGMAYGRRWTFSSTRSTRLDKVTLPGTAKAYQFPYTTGDLLT